MILNVVLLRIIIASSGLGVVRFLLVLYPLFPFQGGGGYFEDGREARLEFE